MTYVCKAFIVALAVLFSFSASGQSISGATSVVAGQTYTYSSGCASTSWYVTNGTIIQNSGDGIVLIQWSSAGSGTISISGCAYLDVIVSNPPPPPYFCQYEVPRPPDTPLSNGQCEATWQICNLPGSQYVWQFTDWGNYTFEQTTQEPSNSFRTPCGGRNTFSSVCVRAVGTSEWFCISY